jgi:hypothetical protein
MAKNAAAAEVKTGGASTDPADEWRRVLLTLVARPTLVTHPNTYPNTAGVDVVDKTTRELQLEAATYHLFGLSKFSGN